MSRRTSLLVLGLGNVLLQDDGLGVTAVTQLIDRYDRPDGVRVVDGGTLGLSLLPAVEESDRLILVDAIQAGGAPGDFVRLTGDDVGPAVASRLSPHQVGVADLLEGARWLDRYPSSVVLLGLVPQSIDLGIGLSPAVQQQVPALVERVVAEARALGFEFRVRAAAPAAGWYVPSAAPISSAS
jgi:hydrogenase maturation protease